MEIKFEKVSKAKKVIFFFIGFGPLKYRFLGFSTKYFIFGFLAQKVGNDLVLAYFYFFGVFSTPSHQKLAF